MGICLALLFALGAVKMSGQTTESTFAVLRSDQVKEWVSGRGEHLICSIAGLGNTAQMNCNTSAPAAGAPLVYHVALIVGPDHVGHVVACGGGILQRLGCEPLTAGGTVTGVIENGKLALKADGKDKFYAVINSSNIGPLTGDKVAATPATHPPRQPHAKP